MVSLTAFLIDGFLRSTIKKVETRYLNSNYTFFNQVVVLFCHLFHMLFLCMKEVSMYRLIYLEPGKQYGAIDSNSQMELIAQESILSSRQITVICVVDYTNKLILNKCKYFDIHRELIDDIIFEVKK